MKLVILGLTVSSSWGNGHATLWRGLCRALYRLGHDIVFFERDVPYYRAHRDLVTPGWGELVLYESWDAIESTLRTQLAEAEVAITTSYCPDAVAATDIMNASPRCLRVFYDLDTPVTLDRLRSGQPVDYLGPRRLEDYDLVLSYTGGRALDGLQSQLGARHVAPLYGFVDPDAHHPANPNPHWTADLSYLGTYAADRQAALEELFVEPARRCPARRFLIGGAQYPQDFPWTQNLFFVRHVEPSQHPTFFCSSRLTLNVTRRAMRECGTCPSGRLFEAAACGAPLVSDAWDGLDTFFEPGSEILVASTADDVVQALNRSDAELRTMANQARERVLSEHTATHRAIELEHRLAEAAGREPLDVAAVGGGN